jgi:predicted HAD superfamily Cof-like phosphohydrolase
MSNDLVKDISEMHQKFGVNDWFEKNKHDKVLMKEFLRFRINMCLEELLETATAANLVLHTDIQEGLVFKESQNNDLCIDSEEVVDGLIDLSVFAIGTLDVFNADANKAWDAVYDANMVKESGVKPGRPNKWGLPDMIKPKMETHGYDWVAPSHEGNHGDFK